MSSIVVLDLAQNILLFIICPVLPKVAIDSDFEVVIFFCSLHFRINSELSVGISVLLTTSRLYLLHPSLLVVCPDAAVVFVIG